MVTEAEFASLYSQYVVWENSQRDQTDGYEYEHSFELFARELNKTLFKMATDVGEQEGSMKERSKKKYIRNMVK